VHFELDLLATEHFSNWWKQRFRNERNDHGEWNGLNLLGVDPRQVLLQQKEQGIRFSLLQFVQNQTELCRVLVHQRDFPWVKRYAPLIRQRNATDKQDIAGYEIALNFNGLPFELIPRGRSDFSGKSKFKLLSVNEQEALKNPCRGLLMKRAGRWQLTARALDLLGMLTY
jgi:hypothetical protein